MSHATPAIRISGSTSYKNDIASSNAARPLHTQSQSIPLTSSRNSILARPMAIPNARDPPPPPLPPPRYIGGLENGEDPGWKYGNRSPTSPGACVKPGSSLLGSVYSCASSKYSEGHSPRYDSHDFRRGSSASTITPLVDPAVAMDGLEPSDDDHATSGMRSSLSSFRFHSESQLGRREVHTASQAYDKQLLSKIGGPNRIPTVDNRAHNKLKPLSVPEHRYSSLDSPLSRWQSAPSSGISPGGGFRSPNPNEHHDGPFSSSSRLNSVSASDAFDDAASSYRSHRNSDDHGVFLDPELTRMDGLELHDRQPSGGDAEALGVAGIKRRASSPPSDGGAAREDRVSGSGNDLYHRRSMQMLANKHSPITRPAQYGNSLSSTASLGPKSASLMSTWTMSTNASSLTSYTSGERLSPGALSPSADFDLGGVSPYAASRTLHRSPRSSLSKGPHQLPNRNPSDLTQDSTMPTPAISDTFSPSSSGSKASKIRPWEGYPHVCECCPKKPKKFDTEEELRMHEMEKQYQCAYCPNRFKNKNEAERHQNSLHLRRHSWACAALSGVSAAFHSSHIHPTTFDVCGYCGEEFPNPPNWDLRAEHLCQQHKFGECNQAKKFFRADHFRQHLKHSHAGTSGKWTNMLENACMKEEPTPAPLPPRNLVAPILNLPGAGQPPNSSAAYPGPPGPYPTVISQMHEDA